MKRTIGFLMVATLALVGCHEHMFLPDYEPPIAPTGLRTATGDNFIELFWKQNYEPDLAGYNVYAATSPSGAYALVASTHEAYFLDDRVLNGITYYYAVSAFDYEGNESPLSRDVVYDIPRPEGYNVVLGNFHVSPNTGGYDFSEYAVVPFDNTYADIWYEYYAGEYYMVVANDTDIEDMGPTGSLLDVKVAPASGWSTTHDATLRVGHTYVVWTWDDHYAKFRVTSLSSGRVVIDWAYQLQQSTPLLKRGVTERKARVVDGVGHEKGGTLSVN